MSAPADVPAAVRMFRTQLAAVAWLQASGYRVSKSLFSQHVRKGLIACNAAGLFEVPALLGYAAVNLTPTARIEDAQAAAVGRLSADADWRAVKAERERIKLQKESGLVMPCGLTRTNWRPGPCFSRRKLKGSSTGRGRALSTWYTAIRTACKSSSSGGPTPPPTGWTHGAGNVNL